MKKIIFTAALLSAASGYGHAANTQYNGLYDLNCDSLTMQFSVGLGGATTTQTDNAILLDSDGANFVVEIPMDCENPESVAVDTQQLRADTVAACHAFEENDSDPWVTENLPCEAIASAATWMWSGIATSVEPILFKSIDMSVRRSGNWLWRVLGFDAVDYIAVTSQDQVVVNDNMLIDNNGKWGLVELSGLPIPLSGEFEGVQLTGCALTQVITATGDVDVVEAGNITTANTMVDQDATCTANYEDQTLAINVSAKISSVSNGASQ